MRDADSPHFRKIIYPDDLAGRVFGATNSSSHPVNLIACTWKMPCRRESPLRSALVPNGALSCRYGKTQHFHHFELFRNVSRDSERSNSAALMFLLKAPGPAIRPHPG
jgi:hypothetical protein